MPESRIEIPADTIINNRYKVISIIGRGGIGTTFKVLDRKTDSVVALKALEIERIENLKELELFEREIDVLKNIDNPLIPDYIEDFQTKINGHALYILESKSTFLMDSYNTQIRDTIKLVGVFGICYNNNFICFFSFGKT